MKKKVTTTDIAKMAGVSQATVSMILNKKYNVSFSRETIEKVEKAAEELGYHKSECRRASKLTGQKLIAVFCPTLTNPYPEQGKILRKIMPKAFILVPGYGAQGGKGKDLVHFFNEDGLGAIVNSSRGHKTRIVWRDCTIF